MTTEERIAYLEATITEAARSLRGLPSLDFATARVATDLEDALRWTTDPATCGHPFWNARQDGATCCRTCGADTTGMEEMGS